MGDELEHIKPMKWLDALYAERDALRAENARLREDLARMFEELPETTWTSKDVAYAIRNFTTRAAMGESDG